MRLKKWKHQRRSCPLTLLDHDLVAARQLRPPQVELARRQRQAALVAHLGGVKRLSGYACRVWGVARCQRRRQSTVGRLRAGFRRYGQPCIVPALHPPTPTMQRRSLPHHTSPPA